MSKRKNRPPSGWVEAARRADWKNSVRAKLERDLGLGDVWDADDPYDLAEYWPGAFAAGQSPRAFVEEAFYEDYASQGMACERRCQVWCGE